MSDIYIRNSERIRPLAQPISQAQYSVPPKYSGVTVVSPEREQVQNISASGSAVLSMNDRSDRRESAEQPLPDETNSVDTAQTASAVVDDTSDNNTAQPNNNSIDGGSDTANYIDEDTLLYKRAPIETAPDGYNCRGEANRPRFSDIADYAALADTAAGEPTAKAPPVEERTESRYAESPQNRRTYGKTWENPPEITDNSDNIQSKSDGDSMNIIKSIISSAGSDDMILCALILLMLAERSRNDSDSVHDDNLLLLLGFLLLMKN